VGLVVGGLLILGLIVMALGGSKQPKVAAKKKDTVNVADANKKDTATDPEFRGPAFLTPPPKKQDSASKGIRGRYVRIELPGEKRILSLAEVEVFSGDDNVAPKGKASQSSTSHEGAPERAVDGNKDGAFPKGSVTHTNEEREPWWELDLGSDLEIRKVVVWNRTDENLGQRLMDFSLVILDAKRMPVWRKEKVIAPNPYYMFFPK
jgi:hypothetical protein